MPIDRPIFLLGPGRSGSTLLNNLITFHRDVGYFISWSSKYPRLSFLCLGAWLRSSWLEKKHRRIRYYPAPTEPYSLWTYCFPRFWKICREPCVDESGARRLRRLISTHLKLQHKSRFLAKLTGPPMFRFFESIFPDARFVWIDRDPRAVSYSYYLRRKIDLPPGLSDQEMREERLRRAALRYLQSYELLQTQETDYHTLYYEDLVANPLLEMRRLLRQLSLDEDRDLLRLTAEWPIQKNANQAWQESLDPKERTLLENILARPLRDRRYI